MKRTKNTTKHLEKNTFAELFGWFGTVSMLSAYALLSLGIVDGDSLLYHSIFLTGCIGLSVVTYRHKAYQSLVVNLTFIILAVAALFRLLVLA